MYQAKLPSYRLEYELTNAPDGKGVLLKGTLYQENVPEDWSMILPLVMKFGKDQVARGPVVVNGAKSPVSIKLPAMPDSVELDPAKWILSEKTSAKKIR